MRAAFYFDAQRWAKLREQARGTISAKLQTSHEIKDQLAELTEEAEALASVAESDTGLNDEQQKRWDELMNEDKGLISATAERLQQAKNFEGQRKRLASLRLAHEGRGDRISNPLQGSEYDRQTGEMSPYEFAAEQNRSRLIVPARFRNRVPLRAFRNDDQGRVDAYNSGMWMRAFLAALRGGKPDQEAEAHCEKLGWDIMATMTEGTDSAGGHLVPDPLQAAFIERREAVSVLRPLADSRVMTSDTLKIPKLTSGPSVTYPGEATAPTPSDQVWGSVSLTAVKRMVLSKVSSELIDDALINVIDQLVNRMAYEFAKQEDNEAVNGDGTATYGSETGLLSALGTAGKQYAGGGSASGSTTWGDIVMGDFTDLLSILPDDYWASPSWLCSSAFFHNVMLRLQAAAGGNTIATLEAGGRTMPMFLGYPVRFTGRMPTATGVDQVSCLFGTFEEGLILGDRQGLRLGMSTDRYFDEDVTAVRGTTRIDWNVHEGGDASDAGAYVGLSTSAT